MIPTDEDLIFWLVLQLTFTTWWLIYTAIQACNLGAGLAVFVATPASAALWESYEEFARWYYR